MSREILDTHQKALQINLDPGLYGTFAEIGAGQEVARWFFRVGGAAGTIAKSMSAYDMTVSDAIYGSSERYVSRQRLRRCSTTSIRLLLERLDAKRGDNTRFFVFADTVAAEGYTGKHDLPRLDGHPVPDPPRRRIRRKSSSTSACSTARTSSSRKALGIIGVNLIHGALSTRTTPKR